ncbi:MAG TPA: neutral zinc metallopeptidase [Azospirillaceae bacterium]|nr:neutral zinc metallopeptidase [Azospirillaceae bacterium]
MRWQDGRRSDNVEDRRGAGGVGGGGLGGLGGRGGFPLRVGGRGLGIGGTVVVLLIGLFLGVDPRMLLGLVGGGGDVTGSLPGYEQQRQAGPAGGPAATDQAAEFVRAVLGYTEDVWHQVFAEQGATYQEPRLVLFSGVDNSGCGTAQSAMGPFYCPADRSIYIDLAFYKDLQTRLGAPGDFAQAYVIAHEVGHHVQTLTGTSAEVHKAQRGLPKAQANALSVRLELQADCYAGIWANRVNARGQVLEVGDVEEALGAAAAVGDDRLQSQAQGRVVPDSFTHGSSEQRAGWFRRGFESGRLDACDTFSDLTAR